jgi:hypothetical protein
MAEGRSRAEWGRTSALLALIANCHRDPKKRNQPYTPADFDPHARKAAGPPAKVNIKDLKHEFLGAARRARREPREKA